MTEHHDAVTPGVLRLALRALPRAARESQGPELAAIFAEATDGRGRPAVLREAADVAAHGLRLRAGLGGQGRADEIVVRAVPLAVSLCASQGLLYVVTITVMLMNPPQFTVMPLGNQLDLVVAASAAVVWLAVLALLLVGRWGAARIVGVLGTLAQIPAVAVAVRELPGARGFVVANSLLPSLFLALLLLAVPRDLVGPVSRRDRRAAVAVALLALAPYGMELVLHYPGTLLLVISFMWVLPMAAALLLGRRGAVGVGALGLASAVGVLRFGVPTLASMTSWREVAAGAVVVALVVLAWRGWVRRGAERRAVRS